MHSTHFHALPQLSVAEGVSLLESPSRFKQTPRVVFQDDARLKRGQADEAQPSLAFGCAGALEDVPRG
jgi:hypothetical protein